MGTGPTHNRGGQTATNDTRLEPPHPGVGHALRGGVFLMARHIALRALRFVASIALARMLMPEVWGVFGIIETITFAVGACADAGLFTALIRQPHTPDDRAIGNALSAQLLLGALGFALVVVLTPVLFPVIGLRSWAVVPLFTFLGCHVVLAPLMRAALLPLERGMSFDRIAILELGQYAAGSVLTVVLALMGFRIWALVGGSALAAAGSVLVAWWVYRPKARFVLRPAGLRPLFALGIPMQAVVLVGLLRERVGTLAGPFVLTVEQVGMLVWAAGAASSLQVLSATAARVTLPLYASQQDEPERLSRSFLATLWTCLAMGAPLAVAIALFAEPVVHVVYGHRWDAGVPALRLFALGIVPALIAAPVFSLVNAKGRPNVGLRLTVIWTVATWVGVGALWPLVGWLAIPGGLLAGSLVASVLALRIAREWLGRSPLGVVFRPLAAALIWAGPAWAADRWCAWPWSWLAYGAAYGMLSLATAIYLDRDLARSLRARRLEDGIGEASARVATIS